MSKPGACRRPSPTRAVVLPCRSFDPGTYEVTFTMQGFPPVTAKGIELHVNDRIEIDTLTLKTGG